MASVMSYCQLGNYAARSHSAEQAPSHTWTKYRQYSSQRNYARYKQLRNQTVQSVRNDHENYRKKVIRSFKGTPKKFFGYMRSFQTVKQKVSKLLDKKGELSETDQEAAEVLCESVSYTHLTLPTKRIV